MASPRIKEVSSIDMVCVFTQVLTGLGSKLPFAVDLIRWEFVADLTP